MVKFRHLGTHARRGTHVIVIGAVVALREPSWFGIGDFAQFPGSQRPDCNLLARNGTNLKPLILRLLEHFLSMKAVEDLRSILTCYLLVEEHTETAGMEVGEAGKIEDARVDDDPLEHSKRAMMSNRMMLHTRSPFLLCYNRGSKCIRMSVKQAAGRYLHLQLAHA